MKKPATLPPESSRIRIMRKFRSPYGTLIPGLEMNVTVDHAYKHKTTVTSEHGVTFDVPNDSALFFTGHRQ